MCLARAIGSGLLVGLLVWLPAPRAVAGDAAAVQEAYDRAFALQRARRTDEALAAWQQALAIDPDHAPSWYELGWSYYVLSRWEDVVRCWERVLQIDPGHADAAKYLPEARSNRDLAARARQEGPPPALAPRDGRVLRLAFGGDTMLGSEGTTSGLPPAGGGRLFEAYAQDMKAADLAFLNLEGVLADAGVSEKCEDATVPCYAFRTPTRFTGLLLGAGVDVVSLANNHASDFGAEGRASTRKALESAGIEWTGPAGKETVVQVDGRAVAFVGFSTSVGHNDLRRIDAARQLVAEAASRADLVVVSFHGGAEGETADHVPGETERFLGEDRGDVRAFARACVEAGADLVVGHGPHVLRGMEVWQGRLIAYSLGNFVTYGGFNLKGPNGNSVLLIADLHPDGRLAGGRVIAARQVHPGGPIRDPDARAIAVIQELSRADFPNSAAPLDDDGTLRGAP